MMNKGPKKNSRRLFLNQIGGIGAGLLIPFEMKAISSLQKTGQDPKNILILGAGLAGLAAAWELNDAGHDIRILEARMRPGGRVHTIRQPFAGDLNAEAGGYMFSESYTQANRYIEALGLKKVQLAPPKLKTLYHLEGRRIVPETDRVNDWPYSLSPEEKKLGPMGIVKKYLLDTLPEEIRDPNKWNSSLADLDKISLAGYMKKHGASDGAIKLVQATQYFAAMPDQSSMLSIAMSDFGLFMQGAPFMIEGGNDRLPTAMAGKLSNLINYGVEIHSIIEKENGVEVLGRRADRDERFEADHVICTFPATVLRSIKFIPELTADKVRAINGIPYLDITRTFLQVDHPFWQEEGLTGMAYTDLSIQIYQHPTYQLLDADQRSILEGYISGPQARSMAKKPADEIIEYNVEKMSKVHQNLRQHVEGGVVKAWSEDPYSLGGPSWAGPGDVTAYLKALQQPHGHIHFAGEHTTILRSTMEGALRSGLRAAGEVNDAS